MKATLPGCFTNNIYVTVAVLYYFPEAWSHLKQLRLFQVIQNTILLVNVCVISLLSPNGPTNSPILCVTGFYNDALQKHVTNESPFDVSKLRGKQLNIFLHWQRKGQMVSAVSSVGNLVVLILCSKYTVICSTNHIETLSCRCICAEKGFICQI